MIRSDAKSTSASGEAPLLRGLYLDLLKAALRNTLYPAVEGEPWALRDEAASILAALQRRYGTRLPQIGLADVERHLRHNRRVAHTLADARQIENVQYCVERVIEEDIPGDLIETGVYRGGQTIFMRGLLKAWGITDRRVFVADSFQGLPEPKVAMADAIAHDFLAAVDHFRISCEEVRGNFARYGLLDEQVCFLEGWFIDTLPCAPIDRLAVIRLDGDYYESTMEALAHLYPKLSPGGFVIIDDYGHPVGCREAVVEYRQRNDIGEQIQDVNEATVYWRRDLV